MRSKLELLNFKRSEPSKSHAQFRNLDALPLKLDSVLEIFETKLLKSELSFDNCPMHGRLPLEARHDTGGQMNGEDNKKRNHKSALLKVTTRTRAATEFQEKFEMQNEASNETYNDSHKSQ